MKDRRRLLPVLGTAQLGLDYGIANTTGKPDQRSATAIVKKAWSCGVKEFDTAQAYGSSESTLGNALAELGLSTGAKVITKPHPDLDHRDGDALTRSVRQSLERLKVPSLFGVMFHREEMLSLWDQGLSGIAAGWVASGLTRHIGLSVYSPAKAIAALNTDGINMVQVPTNILDRRFERAGVFDLAGEKDKTVYIRSAYLQGLILMRPHQIPTKLPIAESTIRKVNALAAEMGLNLQELALGYLKHNLPSAKIVFGAETPWQVSESMLAWRKTVPEALGKRIRNEFPDVDECILNPTRWP